MAEKKAARVETDRAGDGPVETAGGGRAQQESGVRAWQGDGIVPPPTVLGDPEDDDPAALDDGPVRPRRQ